MRSRPVGVLMMEDEAGQDEKILAVPHDALFPFYKNVSSCRGLPDILLEQIAHFFNHYKELEKGKWVKVLGWGEAEEAGKIIMEAIERAGPEKAAATARDI